MATQFPMEAHRERLGWWAGPSRPTSLIVITTPEDTVHIQTAAVQTLRDHEHGAVVPPVHLASTYELDPRTDDGLYRSEEHTSELQSRGHLVCRLLLEKKNIRT